MTLDKKIENHFKNLKLEPKEYPEHSNHIVADYIELVTLFNCDSIITENEILDRFNDYNIHISNSIKKDNEDGSLNTENSDSERNWIHQIFLIIEGRSLLFKEDYPFIYKDKALKMKDILTEKNKIYIMLLLSSNLNYFSSFESILTSEFESISSEVLKNYLPKSSVIKEFGKNSLYQGNAKDKINLLAQEMNIEVNTKEVDRILGNQERGLDIIAWIPFEDKNPNMFSILVQCACGKEWYKKQSETRRYESSYFRFYKLKPIHCMFIPYNIVDINSNLFFQSDEIIDTLIFERKRILQYIFETSFFNSLSSSKIIEYALKYKEDIL